MQLSEGVGGSVKKKKSKYPPGDKGIISALKNPPKKKAKPKPKAKKKAAPTSTGYKGSHPLLGGDRTSEQNPPKKKSTHRKKTKPKQKQLSAKELVTAMNNKGKTGVLDAMKKPTVKKKAKETKRRMVHNPDYDKAMAWEAKNKAGVEKLRAKARTKTNAEAKRTRPKPTVQQYVNASKYTSSSSSDYVVKAGDTLSEISQKYTGSGKPSAYNDLARKNGIKDPNKIKVGQRIKLGIEKKKKRVSVFQ